MSVVEVAERVRCPFCSSRDLRGLELSDRRELVLVCMGCAALFEPETRDNPCGQMCNNCAFRDGSPERAAPWRWIELLEATIERGQPFHCHKNLRCEMTEAGYRFIQPDNGLPGMTRCAGWRSRLAAYRAGVPLHKL